MKYEMIREIFNHCSNNQMRDIFVEEVVTDNPRAWVENFLAGKDIYIEETKKDNGEYIFDVVIANLHQRFSFTPDD